MIEVKELVKEFKLTAEQKKEDANAPDKVRAVDNVSFSCQPGRIFSLLGPNGAGKTTTLRMMATILKPTSGKIYIGGHEVQEEPREVRRKLGFLTGSTGLYDRLTPAELVKYFADLYDVDNNTFKRKKEELFTLLDIHPFANKRVGKLSTGMKQRVSIARTLIHDPEVLVFDEPTSGLDVISAHNIIELIRNSKDQGKTVIFSTHIMGEVELLSDDIAIIHNGHLLFNNTFAAFKDQMQSRNLVEEFIRFVKVA